MKTRNTMMALMMMTSATATAGTWNANNNPKNFDSKYEYRLSALPEKGKLGEDKMPWSETYWPSVKGSINLRWNLPKPIGFKYVSPTREQVMKMSKEELATLSPSEKYDLAMGHYDYPLKKEVDWYADKNAKDWNGICHGWAPAALQFREPKPVEILNPDGITIPFGSSDVKGLLSFFMAFHAEIDVVTVGARCRKVDQILGLGGCKDTNPGALHVILANELGMRGQGLVAEIDPGPQVWNQPVYGFEVLSVASIEAKNSASAVEVKSIMYYADELEKSLWTPVNGTEQFKVGKLELRYTLELDEEGKIVGGEWISKKFPDFLWKATSEAKFSGQFEGLNKIYQPSL